MKQQEIFDQVTEHLMTQKRRAIRNGMCLYRVGKLKCAVGVLIQDEFYDPVMESEGPGQPLVKDALRKSGVKPFTDGTENLLLALQSVHDDFKPSQWPQPLRDVAKDFKLKCSL